MVLPAGMRDVVSQSAAPAPDKGVQSAGPNSDELQETQQAAANTSFISIFLQGKTRLGNEDGKQAENKTPCPVILDSGKETAADADSVQCSQLVQLFAAAGVTGTDITGAAQTESSLYSAQSGLPMGGAAAVPVNVRLESEMTPGESGEQTDAVGMETGTAQKITELLESMNGGNAQESGPGDTAPKKNAQPLPEKITEGYAPPYETAFTGASELAEDGELRSFAVERALDRFRTDLSRAETGNSEIRIVLEPEDLGALTISVSRSENGVSARIRSDNRETCAVIADQIQGLIRSMKDEGIKVDDIDVVFGQMEQDLSFAQNPRGNSKESTSQNFLPQTHEKTGTSDRTGFFDTWNNYVGSGDKAIGAIEYRI